MAGEAVVYHRETRYNEADAVRLLAWKVKNTDDKDFIFINSIGVFYE
jgi:hypothetical protein